MAIDSDYSRAGYAVSLRRAALLPILAALLASAVVLAALPAAAQYPVETAPATKSKPELRAVAVLEWTGKAGHPTASRLIPISIFDGQQLQDGDIYLARPQPLTLDADVEYELEQDGKTVGLYDIDNASLVQGAWVGYGTWKPLPKPKPAKERANSRVKYDFADNSGRPVLHIRPGADDTSNSGTASKGQAAPADEGRPTLHRAGSADDSGNSAPSNPPPATDGPTLHGASGGSASSSPADDSSGPTLRKAKKDKKEKKRRDDSDQAYVETVPQVFDPGRPHLFEGQPKSPFAESAGLRGMPPDMHQEIAVSDANNTPDHPWNFIGANPDEEAAMKAALEEIARKDLESIPPPAAPTADSLSAQRRAHKRTAASASPPPTLQPPAPLLDEHFRVFQLAYDSGATLVFSAHTAGTGANEKYITLIAQPGLYGNVFVLFKNVTDAADLDLTPRMRLIGAVDALDNNRGELLFELRGATQRQFALYQVYNGQVTQLLVTSGGSFASETGG